MDSGKSNLLLKPDAFGNPNTFVSGQGKGFPNATPQVSVGSTNVFSRRAIARRAGRVRRGSRGTRQRDGGW